MRERSRSAQLRRWSRLLALLLCLDPTAARAEEDTEIARGIRQIEEGDLLAAIVTLDAAAQRLAADPARVRDLSQAYLYLGVAYVGRGHEAAAKAKFREAVLQIKDLTLSPDKFSPKVIDLFEAARAEVTRTGAAAASPPGSRKGGGGKTPLIVGGVVLAGGAAALVLKDGGGGMKTETFEGVLTLEQHEVLLPITTGGSGSLTATLTWVEPNAHLDLYLEEQATGRAFAEGSRTGSTSLQLTAQVVAKQYVVGFFQRADSQGVATYRLVVRHP